MSAMHGDNLARLLESMQYSPLAGVVLQSALLTRVFAEWKLQQDRYNLKMSAGLPTRSLQVVVVVLRKATPPYELA